jgi:hypothetical protein
LLESSGMTYKEGAKLLEARRFGDRLETHCI